jgi:NifU-like protein
VYSRCSISAHRASEALCAIIESGSYTPIQALKIQNQDIVAFLEGLPDQKIHCSVMGAEALEAAVFDWARKRGVDLSLLGLDHREDDQEEGKLVCECFSVTEPYLKRKIKELNLRTIPEITNAIKAGGACMSCHHVPGGLQDLLDETWGVAVAERSGEAVEQPEAEAQTPLSPYQFAKKVEKAIEEYVRPMLQQDGGDLEIVDIKDRLVYCRLAGACAGCAGASQTLRMMVEGTLKDNVDQSIRVIQVSN